MVPHAKLDSTMLLSLLGVARTRWLNSASPAAAANLHSHSGWSAGAALLHPLSELALQLPDATVSVAVRERLGLVRVPCNFCPHVFNNRRVCNAEMRAGAHVHCCRGTLVPRTRFRHNPLVG